MAEGWQGWDDYAPFYDWENAQTLARRDVRFWQRLAAAQDGRVLELGCGTGRLTVPVARTGAHIVGIDRSPAMLARARQRLRRARLRAPLIRGDIRQLPFRRRIRFDLVMAPYGMLQSLTSDRDLRQTLDAVAAVLTRGGLFAIDLVPDLPRWAEYDRRVSLSGRRGQGHVRLTESVRQAADAVAEAGQDTLRQRLERAGFRIDALLGDYDGGPLDLRADVWIILARRNR